MVSYDLGDVRVGHWFPSVHRFLVSLENQSVHSPLERVYILGLCFSCGLLDLELRVLLAEWVSVPLSGELLLPGLV